MSRYGRTTSSRQCHHGVKAVLTSLYIFPSHEHGFTGFLLCPFTHKSGDTQESIVSLLEEFDGSASVHTRNLWEGHGSGPSGSLGGCSGKSSIQKDKDMDILIPR